MSTALATGGDHRFHIDIQHVSRARPRVWLALGWRDLSRNRAGSLAYGAVMVALGWTLLVFCSTHPYFVAAAITGFLLVGPALSAGLCEMSRRYSLGEHASFDESLEGFTRNASALSEFGVILAICAAAWFLISGIMLESVFHIAAPSISETLYRGFLDSANRSQVLAYISVGGLLAAGVFGVSVIAIPLIIDRHATARQAMRASVTAVLSNIPAMLVWSAMILVLIVIGYASLLLGLLIVAPLLGHATWHAYHDIVPSERRDSILP
jgi:uncharacterized membrane protein